MRRTPTRSIHDRIQSGSDTPGTTRCDRVAHGQTESRRLLLPALALDRWFGHVRIGGRIERVKIHHYGRCSAEGWTDTHRLKPRQR